MNDATVVVAPDGTVGEQVLERAAQWTDEGLLRSSVWTSPRLVSDEGVHAVRLLRRIRGDELDLTAEEPIWIEHALGRELLERIRIVVLNVVNLDGTIDAGMPEAAQAVLRRLRATMPANVELVTINAVVPANSNPLPREHLELPRWDTNIIVAPEDRVSPRGIDQGIRTTEELVAHAAFHGAVAGCLFSGQSDGPFDIPREGSAAAKDPPIGRAFARAIVSPSFFPRLARTTLVNRSEWPTPEVSSDRQAAIPGIDPARILREALISTRDLRDGELTFKPRSPRPAPKPHTIGLISALVLMLKEVWSRLLRAPSRFRDRIEHRAATIATQFVKSLTGLGAGSSLVPTFGGVEPPEMVSVQALANEADRLAEILPIAGTQSATFVPAVPEVWATLRGLSFSLIDGGSIPDPYKAPIAAGRREILTRPKSIAPDPNVDPFLFSGDLQSAVTCAALQSVSIEVTDPYGVLGAHKLLHGARERLADEEAQDLAPKPPQEPGQDAETENAPSTAQLSADELEVRRGKRNKQRELLNAANAELDSWDQEQGSAFWWQLGTLLSKQLENAREALANAVARLQQLSEEELDANEAAKVIGKRFRRFLRFVSLGVILAGIATTVGRAVLLASLPIAVITIAVIVLGSLFTSAWGYLKYCRDMFALEYALDSRQHVDEELIAEIRHNLYEVQRLAHRYLEFQQWAEIVGHVVHAPFGRDEPDVEVTPELELDEECLPEAFRTSRGIPATDKLQRLAQIFMRKMFSYGWLSEAYETCVDRTSAMLDENYGIIDPNLSPDHDDDRGTVREHLRLALRDGTATGKEREEQLETLRRFCEDQRSSELLGGVEVTDPETGEKTQHAVAEFLGELLSDEPSAVSVELIRTAEATPFVETSLAWLPIGEVGAAPDTIAIRPFTPVVDATRPYIVIALLYQQTSPISLDDHTLAMPAEFVRVEPDRPPVSNPDMD